ncbi:MAG: hypothetical protein AAF202_12515, partial [Pseudomonadota bacterium]
ERARQNPEYNVPWSQLPAKNQLLDLGMVEQAFRVRAKLSRGNLETIQISTMLDAVDHLKRKISESSGSSQVGGVMSCSDEIRRD